MFEENKIQSILNTNFVSNELNIEHIGLTNNLI